MSVVVHAPTIVQNEKNIAFFKNFISSPIDFFDY